MDAELAIKEIGSVHGQSLASAVPSRVSRGFREMCRVCPVPERQGLAGQRQIYAGFRALRRCFAGGLRGWRDFCWASRTGHQGERPMSMMIYGLAGLMAGAGLHALPALKAQVEAFAGRPALLDARLLLPACAAASAVNAGPARVKIAEAAAAIRRGDRVVVEAGGAGFSVSLDAVALADARGDRVPVRRQGEGPRGRTLSGIIGADGVVRINGLNGVVKGR
jgi:flagella basal body P-ring formation protein FlgA